MTPGILIMLSIAATWIMDVIMTGMSAEYGSIRFQAMKDPEISLEELQLIMRNMHMNGFTASKCKGKGTAMTAGLIKRDKLKVKCHSCGKLGHYKGECMITGLGRQSSSNRNSIEFKPRYNDNKGNNNRREK